MFNKGKYFGIIISFLAIVLTAANIMRPKILIVGDSISGGYTPFVIDYFKDIAIVTHNPGNARHIGWGLENIRECVGNGDWDIIQFNWGLWDLCYRHPDSKLYDIDKETLLIITSDNGATVAGVDAFGHRSCRKLKGRKGTRWEGGHRIPLLIKWDRQVKPNSKNDGLICLVDIMATLANLIGHKLDSNMGEDSFNALPLITGQQKDIRESLVMHDYQGRFAIRKGYWKLVENELYNLAADLEEKHSVAADYPEKVRELKILLKKQQDDGLTVKR